MKNNDIHTGAEFLAALKKRLRALPKEEREAALSYYAEYLEEGSVEELGSVDEVARQILEQCAVDSLESKEKKGGLKTLWIVLLAVFAAPIALPILLALAVVILSLFIVIAAVALALAISGAAAVLAGFFAVILCFIALPHSLANGLMVAGAGLASAGLGILLFIGGWYAARGMIWLLSRMLGGIVKRGEK